MDTDKREDVTDRPAGSLPADTEGEHTPGERDRLLAVNAELVAAAQAVVNSDDYADDDRPLMRDLRTALQHAKENGDG